MLDQHHLTYEEVLELDVAIQVGVRLLLAREPDVRADGKAPRLLGPAVRGLHQPGTSACHHGEAGLREREPQLPRKLVVRMTLVETRGAEDRDGGPVHVHELESRSISRNTRTALSTSRNAPYAVLRNSVGAEELLEQSRAPQLR